MPKQSNQKLKMLYLLDILRRQTDEHHPLTMPQIISALAIQGITAERKSIYNDIEALRAYGMDVVRTKTGVTGYFLASRSFELTELKLLVDSVQSSKFITQKKTLALIGKIESLASTHEARLLHRQVHVRNRIKSMNESVYYNVDELSNAINSDRQIRFKYFEYTVTKERRWRKNGGFYQVSPFSLTWDDEKYYMLAYDSESNLLKHFRVDKMAEITILNQCRLGKENCLELDMGAYHRKVFAMFAGKEKLVTISFASHLANVVIDRFGRETIIIADVNDDRFTVSVPVAVSPQFFAWIFGFGAEAEVIAPAEVRAEMEQRLLQTNAIYRQ